jgi:hypothetical protein
VQADRGEDRVLQVNIHVFPLTAYEEKHAPTAN